MTSNIQPVTIAIGASYGGANEAFNKVSQAMENFANQMRQQMESVNQTIQQTVGKTTEQLGGLQKGLNVSTLLSGLQPMMQALGAIKDKINDTVKATMTWTAEVNSLSRTLGTNTIEAGGLAKALEKLNISTDTYRGAVFQLQRSLNTNEKALNANGIATRNARGDMLDVQTVMMNTLNRLCEMKPGYDANALAMMAFGRGAKELEGLMKLTNERISDGAKKVKELGIEVDANATGAVRRYKEAMFDVKDTLEALKIKMGQELMPVLAEAAQSFAKIANVVMPVLSKALAGLISLSQNWSLVLGALAVVLRGSITSALTYLSTTVLPLLMTRIRALVLTVAIGKLQSIPILIGAITKSIVALATSFTGVIAIIAGVVWVIQRLATASSRAAEASAELTQSMIKNHSQLSTYSQQLIEVERALEATTKGSQEYNKLIDKKRILLERLKIIYPKYSEILDANKETQSGLLEVLKKINQEELMQLKIKETRLALEEKMLESQIAQKNKYVTLATADNSPARSLATWLLGIGDKQKALEITRESLKQIREELLNINNTSPEAGKKIVPNSNNSTSKSESRMSDYSEEFRVRQANIAAQQGEFYETSLQDERTFWSDKLQLVGLSSKDYTAILLKIYDIDKAINKERTKEDERSEKERVAIAEAELEHHQTLSQTRIDNDRQYYDHQVDMGRMTADERLEIERELLQAEYELQVNALKAQLELADISEAEKIRIFTRIQQAQENHLGKLKGLDNQYELNQQARQDRMFGNIKSGFEEGFAGMLNGSMRLCDSWDTLLQGMGKALDQFIIRNVMQWNWGETQKELATLKSTIKIVAQSAWAATKTVALKLWSVAQEVAATTWGAIQEVAITSWKAIQKIAINSWETIKSIVMKAYEAMAAIWASFSAMGPWGVAAGAAVGAGVMAAIIGLSAKISSAAGGWGQIPNDQLAMVHKDEMVLPAKYANPMRDMLEGGNTGYSEGAVNITINAVDAASVERLFKQNGSALVREMKRQTRNFAFES